jgi:hypothetical protein
MEIVDKIKGALNLEVRSTPDTDEYFEAVFMSKDLEKMTLMLKEGLGEPIKPAGKDVRFAKDMQKIVDLIGGLRREQSFYVKSGSDKHTYAALWPWQSDPLKITLKIGICGVK